MQDDAPSRGISRLVSITKRARSRGLLPTSGMASATQASSSSVQTTRSKRRRRAVARRCSLIPAKASNAAAAKTAPVNGPNLGRRSPDAAVLSTFCGEERAALRGPLIASVSVTVHSNRFLFIGQRTQEQTLSEIQRFRRGQPPLLAIDRTRDLFNIR